MRKGADTNMEKSAPRGKCDRDLDRLLTITRTVFKDINHKTGMAFGRVAELEYTVQHQKVDIARNKVELANLDKQALDDRKRYTTRIVELDERITVLEKELFKLKHAPKHYKSKYSEILADPETIDYSKVGKP